MNLSKWKLTVVALVGSAFTIFGIWDLSVPVDQQMVSTIIDTIFVILGVILGGGAAASTPKPTE